MNKKLINYLSTRSRRYKKARNPKYFAYDRVIGHLKRTKIKINSKNYRYLRGVGPRIGQHINDFLRQNMVFKQPSPITLEPENQGIVDYLWDQAKINNELNRRGRAFALVRAARTIAKLNESMPSRYMTYSVFKLLERPNYDFGVGEWVSDIITDYFATTT